MCGLYSWFDHDWEGNPSHKKTLANLFDPWFDGFPPHRNTGESCLPSYNGQITLNDAETLRLLDLI